MQAQGSAPLPHRRLGNPEHAADLDVRETLDLGLPEQRRRHFVQGWAGLQRPVCRLDMGHFVQEPAVDMREFMDPVHAVARLESRGDGKDTGVCGMGKGGVQVFRLVGFVAHEAVGPLADHPQSLLQGLLERPADGHHLPDTFHAGADVPGYALELGQVPPRDLAHDIVQGRFEERGCRPGHGILQFEQAITQAQLGRHGRQRIPRRLGGQGRGTAEPRIDLDHPVILPVGAEGILDVALAHDAQMPDDVDGGLPEKMVFVVGERLRRGDDDALAGMDPERVHILHVADGDTVVKAVADHFVFNFLPAPEGLFHQHLGRESEGLAGNGLQLRLVRTEAGTQAAQRIGRPDDDRIAYLPGRHPRLFQRRRGMGPDGLHADLVQPLDEPFPVLRVDDGFHRRSQHLHAIPFQDAASEQFHAAVQGRLPAEGEEDTVGALLPDDLFHEGRRNGKEIHLVGHPFGGLHRRDVRIHEHCPDALFPQGLEGLRAAVVEFSGLADLQRARAQDENFPDHSREMNSSNRNSVSTGPPEASGWNCVAKKGFPVCRMPSLVPSFRLTK